MRQTVEWPIATLLLPRWSAQRFLLKHAELDTAVRTDRQTKTETLAKTNPKSKPNQDNNVVLVLAAVEYY